MTNSFDLHLIKAIADMAVFLEFTGEDLLNPDAAIAAMEQLAGELQLMDEEFRKKLVFQFDSLGDLYREGREADFVRNLPDILGFK